jgi:hypothetical protein
MKQTFAIGIGGAAGQGVATPGKTGHRKREEINFPFFAGDRKCIATCQRSLVGHLIAKVFEAQTRLFPKINFFTAS